MFCMIAPYSEWPAWVRIVVIVPLGLLAATLTVGWWPNTRRDWRRFGIAMAYFAVFSLAMIYVFHYT
jgi:hypothetical protein